MNRCRVPQKIYEASLTASPVLERGQRDGSTILLTPFIGPVDDASTSLSNPLNE